jgi:CheY-like chemotaxis protein
MKILFVDNSKTTRAVMTLLLSKHGYEVFAASTGPEAIEKVKVEYFDIAIMDLYMPFMNGYEAAKVIRALPDACKDIPIIALTASNDPRDIDVCKNAGMNEFVVKSDDQLALLGVLKKYASQIPA